MSNYAPNDPNADPRVPQRPMRMDEVGPFGTASASGVEPRMSAAPKANHAPQVPSNSRSIAALLDRLDALVGHAIKAHDHLVHLNDQLAGPVSEAGEVSEAPEPACMLNMAHHLADVIHTRLRMIAEELQRLEDIRG